MKPVSIVQCGDYSKENVEKAINITFENLGGVSQFIKPGMNVMIKANLLMKKRPEEATTTHPTVIEAVADVVRKAGAHATVIDSPGGPYTEGLLKSIYDAAGMNLAAKNSGAKLNFNLAAKEIKNPEGKLLKQLTVLAPLAEADLIINIPKLKTHGMMVYTGAVKNMFGAVPGELKAEYHLRMPNYIDFANALIDIYLSVKPGLNIIDAVIGMDGHGPSSGNPKDIGLIMASADGFAVDLAALSVVGLEASQVPILQNAIERNLCPKDSSSLKVIGLSLPEARLKAFDVPMLSETKDVRFFKSGLLKRIMDSLKPHPHFNHRICIGCAACARSCPAKIITMDKSKPWADLSKCIRCFCCQELCPVKAVTIRRSWYSLLVLRIGGMIMMSFGGRGKKKNAAPK